MKIINKETGAILEASDEIARGYLKNPSFVQLKEELPVKKQFLFLQESFVHFPRKVFLQDNQYPGLQHLDLL